MRTLLLPMMFCALLCAAVAHAELPPGAYHDMQARATEVVEIEVLSVDTSICWFWLCSGRDVEVEAAVKAVERTASGLEPGARIRIVYRHVPLDGRSGPRPIRILEAGEKTPAFLTREGAVYAPGARGASFQPLVDAEGY